MTSARPFLDHEFDESLFTTLAGQAGGSDLTDHAEAAEPANGLRHLAALSASKVADGLIDPKLVLSWLLTHLGAGAGVTGLLVPVREAGALLPQLFAARPVHRMARRKWAWAGGAFVQGAAAAGIALAGWTMAGAAAGWTILGLLALLAVARSVCSVSYKDLLGKTVGKTRRGAVTGAASSAASGAVILFALALMTGIANREGLVLGAIALAALAWVSAAVVMARLDEEDRLGTGGDTPLGQLALLWRRPQLGRFVLARLLLVGTALAPPYLVILASTAGDGALEALGALVLASAAASLLSSFVWGRLSDRSSRKVLILSGVAGGVALALALGLHAAGLAGRYWAMPAVLFVLMIAYHGVRQGRSTYLVDRAGEGDRATYTAVANTAVGVGLLAAGAGAAALASWGVALVIGVFAVMCGAGAALALGLDEVEEGA
ncbi:MFS transporter [Wenxinia marina]|nr:MFS transporter [Wenxinia marina]